MRVAPRAQGTFGVLVAYTLLCGLVVLHALSAYQRVRHGDSPRPDRKLDEADGGGGIAQPTRGCLLVSSWQIWDREMDKAGMPGSALGVC